MQIAARANSFVLKKERVALDLIEFIVSAES